MKIKKKIEIDVFSKSGKSIFCSNNCQYLQPILGCEFQCKLFRVLLDEGCYDVFNRCFQCLEAFGMEEE